MSASSWSFIAGGLLLGLSFVGICIGYFFGSSKYKERKEKQKTKK